MGRDGRERERGLRVLLRRNGGVVSTCWVLLLLCDDRTNDTRKFTIKLFIFLFFSFFRFFPFQVALAMMKAGKSVNVGHHIPYVMCKIEGATSPAERARHPDDILRSNGQLEVDVEW